jgi:hypothetical protein
LTPSSAWIQTGSAKVAFVFRFNEVRVVYEVELTADDHVGIFEITVGKGKGSQEHEDHDV